MSANQLLATASPPSNERSCKAAPCGLDTGRIILAEQVDLMEGVPQTFESDDMNSFLGTLLTDFPPPEKPYHPVDPQDFSLWNLKHAPPEDLVWLYEVYGEGTFEVASGDPIRLMMPTERCVAMWNLHWETLREVVGNGSLDADLFTVGRAWFMAETRPEAILWGSSVNGLDLMSIWISDSIGWATVVFDNQPGDCICVFRTPALALHDAVKGASVFNTLFPWAERPFEFVPDA